MRRRDDLTALLDAVTEPRGRDCRRPAAAPTKSLLCQTRSELQHARCRHASARSTYPTCSCACHHSPTSYDIQETE